jgi:plastocyanin
MYRRGWAIGALVLAPLFVTTACSSSSSSSSGGGATSTSSSQSAAPTDVSGKSSTTMSAENYFFTPAALDGTAGQKLTITLTNAGSVPHNFSISDQNINVTLEPGEQKDIQVAFPQSGSVQFFCVFHQSSGMVGTLEVA